jgi:hypothetical protein
MNLNLATALICLMILTVMAVSGDLATRAPAGLVAPARYRRD